MPAAPTRIAPGPDRRIDILKSAAAAFRRRGYHGASVDEIACALEMTKGNLYYYFRNKEEILYACHDYSLDVLLALLEDVAGRGVAARRQAAQARARLRARDPRRAAGHGAHARPAGAVAAAAPQGHRRRDVFDRGVRAIIQQGMDQGLFAKGDPKMMAFAVMGAVNWITQVVRPGRADVVAADRQGVRRLPRRRCSRTPHVGDVRRGADRGYSAVCARRSSSSTSMPDPAGAPSTAPACR